jgi:HPt (histidine-containing phosphotransfer) domain-containing protein
MLPTSNSSIQNIKFKAFAQEALEQLKALEAELLTLDQSYDISKIHSLMQPVHLLKGGAASFGWSGIETLARHLESTFQVFYHRELEIDPGLQKLLLQSYFCLRIPLLTQLQFGQYDATIALARAEPVFAQLEAKIGSALEIYHPRRLSRPDSNTDLLFSVGLSQWLVEVEELLANPNLPNLAKQLQHKAESLMGLGEYLNISGITAAAKNMMLALQTSSESAVSIGFHVLQVLNAAQDSMAHNETALPVQETANLAALSSSTPSSPKQFACFVDSVILTLPFPHIVEFFIPQTELITQLDQKRFVYWRHQMLPVYQLSELLDCARPNDELPRTRHLPILIFTDNHKMLGLELNIERLINHTELVIQPLTTSIARPPYLGCTIWQESQLVFVIDGASLLRSVLT